MKKLLLILTFVPLFAHGQLFDVTFDPADTLYPHVIIIDTINYHHNIWQIGKPHKTVFDSAYSFPNAIITDTLNSYPPNDTSVFYLKVQGNYYGMYVGKIWFNYQLDIDTGSMGKIDVSIDNGASWVNFNSIPGSFFPDTDTPSLRVSTAGWTLYKPDRVFPLCDTFIVRFTFISGSLVTAKSGWIIDNIHWGYWTLNVPKTQNDNFIILSPNPTKNDLNITSTENITSITITNLIGQTVYTHPQSYNMGKAQIDVSSLPAGVYFIKINGLDVRKFVKM